MITDRVLDLAVAKGLIETGQALALRSLARQEEPVPPPIRPEPADAERFRLVTGFADIFVTLGLALFLGSASFLLHDALPPAGVVATVAGLAWLLAEFFTRRRRMALPSIVLLVVFAYSSFFALALVAGGEPGNGGTGVRLGWLGSVLRTGGDPLRLAAAALGTAALAGVHYWRFRVPITVAAGAAALGGTLVLACFAAAPDLAARSINGILLALGLAVFAAAMAFDLRDPGRLTRRTDIAFWLHLLASPLIVHSIFQAIGAGRGQIDPATSAVVLGVFATLGLVAVLVDRRALLVSGLVYAGVAFGSLIRNAGLADKSLPVTLLALGTFVLLLSAGWAPLRRALLGVMPGAWSGHLPSTSG